MVYTARLGGHPSTSFWKSEESRMKLRNGTLVTGTVAISASMLISFSVHAETVKTVNGVDIDSSVVDAYIQSRAQQPAAQIPEDQKAVMLDELTDLYLITTQDRAKELAKDPQLIAQAELQYRGLLAQATASDYLERNPATDAEIQAEYEKQIAQQSTKQYKARHILVETQDEANKIIAELDDGADFAELATERSTGPSGPQGGDLGWFSPEQMVAPFSEAVGNLEDNTYSKEPVQTQFGWHVILREGSRDNEPPPLDSVRDSVKQSVDQQKLQNFIESLRAGDAGGS
jgi:peptidyl-prolyl cis-trans isomerase C